MSKFNTKSGGTSKTVNKQGVEAYTLDPKLELYATAVTTMLSNKFYESGDETLSRIIDLIPKAGHEFTAKLAVYAREKMYLRSLPLVLAVELAKVHQGDSLVGKTISRVTARADELTELLAYYEKSNGRTATKKLGKLSKQVQKGLADAFNKFNEYAFAKYNRDGTVKLRDALFLVHPKAKDDGQQALFDKIASDTLVAPDTWEVELSKGGDKTAAWERLVGEDKLGYMALLRNLRNILEAKVSDEHLIKVAEKLSNKEEVLKSKQFPFRFLSAYREVKPLATGKAVMLLDALEAAMLVSAERIKGFDLDVSIALSVDTSGSMDAKISEKSKITLMDIGLILGMLLQNRCKNVETSIFGETMKIINLPKNNILTASETLRLHNGEVGHSTNGYLVIQDLIDRKEKKDKVMIFTDCQMWNSNTYDFWGSGNTHNDFASLWRQYRKEVAPNAKLYLFDLAGYGNTPVSVQSGEAYLVAGWSDRVFDMLEAYENGSSAVKEIEAIVL